MSEEKHQETVREILNSNKFIDGLDSSPRKLPPASNTRNELEKLFKICSDRNFRVVLVEDLRDYKIFIQIPNSESECSFYIWCANFKNGGCISELDVPTHDDLIMWYTKFKEALKRS